MAISTALDEVTGYYNKWDDTYTCTSAGAGAGAGWAQPARTDPTTANTTSISHMYFFTFFLLFSRFHNGI